MRVHKLKIGVSGIRGEVGEFLTPALACAFAQAFATYTGPGRVVVGRDTRPSGPMLEHAVACGLLAGGCDVVLVGVYPTPTIQIYVASTDACGGLAITASHNPAEYNALKLFNRQGLFFNTYERSELLDLYHQSAFRHVSNAEIGHVETDTERPFHLHLGRILPHIDSNRIRNRRYRVAVDAVNGAASLWSPRFLEALGCEVAAIHVDPDRPFPRLPEPKPEALDQLRRTVIEQKCAVGFAQDPDADRLAVVDETGQVLDGDDVLALVVDTVLQRQRGNVVVNLSTSSAIDDVARRYGCRVLRAPVGEANVVQLMQATQAVIGGEGSNGGVIYPSVHLCRDSFTGMALILDRMAASDLPLSELARQLPRYFRRAGAVEFEHERLGELLQRLPERFRATAIDRSDGIKLILSDGWIHVRPSNTEPVLRFALEAREPQRSEELYGEVLELLSSSGG